MHDILKAAFFCPIGNGRWGIPLLIHGDSGVGKTAVAEAVSNMTDLYYYRMAPSERGEGQFGVVPVPGTDGYLHYPPPDWSKAVDAAGSVIFLDEIDSVPLAMQAPLLGMVQLRIIGSHQFGVRTRVIAAANGVNGTWNLRSDLANRFCHLDYEGLDPDPWCDALLSGFQADQNVERVNSAALEARVLEAWPAAIAQARGMVSGFIRRRPDLLHKKPVKGSADRAWPSRRTCHDVTRALASAAIHHLTPTDTDTLIAGLVGIGWVSEYRAWSSMADLPAPADVLDGKVKFRHSAANLDRSMAVLGACTALVVPVDAKHRVERASVLWTLIEEVSRDAADITVPAARTLLKAAITKALLSAQAQKALNLLGPVLVRAGIQKAP